MIRSAVPLLQRCGVLGTVFADVLADSGAPRGSVYHHFPGGKAQLAEEATRYAGDAIGQSLQATLVEGDLVDALDRISGFWLAAVQESDFDAGCAVAAGALDPEPDSGARRAAAEAFVDWEQQLMGALVEHGVDAEAARGFATLAISAIEGALILARAQRSVEPLERVTATLRSLAATYVRPAPGASAPA